MTKLHQVVAVESSEKTRLERERTELYKRLQKEALFNGLVRTYEPKDDDGDMLDQEVSRVQMTVEEAVRDFQETTTRLIDITATKDVGNSVASAAIVVDGSVLVQDAPVPLLLFLEKQFEHLETFLRKVPTLDRSRAWKLDANSGLHVSEAERRNSTKKVQRPIVLAQATKEHPAQTQLITEDVIQGVWTTVQQSGGATENQKKTWLAKVAKLRIAVKEARCAANDTEVEHQKIGQGLFNFVFGQ